AFRNDPILAERAVDIGSIGEGLIELAGWGATATESEHAVTLARGVPGVATRAAIRRMPSVTGKAIPAAPDGVVRDRRMSWTGIRIRRWTWRPVGPGP